MSTKKPPGECITHLLTALPSLSQNLDPSTPALRFGGKTAPTRRFRGYAQFVVSLADPEQKLVIYDGRVGGALGYFVARFAEEREIHQYDLADQLLFAVDREAKRRPETNRIHFPALFGKTRDRCHASMVRWASQLIWQVAKECQASPREIEAALFMWGYNVMWRNNAAAAEPRH